MSQLLKGFVNIQTLINNTPEQTSMIGELSQWSRTYTREIGEYTDTDLPGYTLLSTFHKNDKLERVKATSQLVKQVLSVVKAMYAYASSHLRPYDMDDFKTSIMVEFASVMSNFAYGDMVDNGSMALPQWITWQTTLDDHITIKLWLSDDAFQNQYDEYETIVVPPLTVLDDFFAQPGQVLTELAARDLTKMMEVVQDAKQDHPETFIRTLTFNYINTKSNVTQETIWNVIIHGIQGDNVDAIKDALVDYVLANSSHPRSDWEAILPDLFKRTEFVLLPRYDLFAINDKAIQTGIYSPIVDPLEVVNFCVKEIPFYPQAWVQANITSIPFPYKSISICVVNGQNNVEDKQQFSLLFSDFIPVPTTSIDFNRMSLATQQFSEMVGNMLVVAETATELSSVPRTMRKIVRNGKLYISTLVDNVNYLMLAKTSI